MVLATLAMAPRLQKLVVFGGSIASKSLVAVHSFRSLRDLLLNGISGPVHERRSAAPPP